MFKTEKQRSNVCHELLALWDREHLWAADGGPTDEMLQMLEAIKLGEAALSGGEQVWVRVVFDVWNGDGGAPLSEVLSRLDAPKTRALGALVAALHHTDGDAIDNWLFETKRARLLSSAETAERFARHFEQKAETAAGDEAEQLRSQAAEARSAAVKDRRHAEALEHLRSRIQ